MAAKRVPKKTSSATTRNRRKQSGATQATKRASRAPARITNKRPYEGPVEWLFPMLEQAYATLGPKTPPSRTAGGPRPKASVARAAPSALTKAVNHAAGKIRHRERLSGDALAELPLTHWEDVLREYKQRKMAEVVPKATRRRAGGTPPAMPAILGANNWTPLGPSVVAHAQTANRGAVGGRTSGIAIDATGKRIYVATANGGVFRSDDGGLSFHSTMDSFDLDPLNFASTSLACGAIAIDPAHPDRVYVGTGEGDTDALFSARIVNALPAYRGIGPVRSDDGGRTWVNETSSPSLAGFAFYKIAVDPSNPEHCVAATTNGLYERVPSGASFTWKRRRPAVHTSVVVARSGGTTVWFAAERGGSVYRSVNGSTWVVVGTSFPANTGRVALGVQSDNPNIVYAYIATAAGALSGVRRLDGQSGAWRNITGVPDVLPGGQGAYNLCISVDPNNANRIFLGGDYLDSQALGYPASIWRCDITAAGAALSMTGTSLGRNAHADVHSLVHVPGSSTRLFAGSDGGVFEHPTANGAGDFVSRNTGLASLCANFVAQHPTEPAVLYVGLQDNGTAKCTGEAVWRHVLFADGGYCIVNWNDPFRVLLFANGSVYRALDGGLDYGSWADVTPPGASWQLMAEPLVGTPRNPASPAEAEIVAIGVGTTIYVSPDFGSTWPDQPTLPAGSDSVFSISFASATRMFVGTVSGEVFRLDDAGAAGWTITRLDNVTAGPLPLAGRISDIAVDTTDASRSSIYICFGGVGDFRHVWRFDGTKWSARSGTSGSGTQLLDVEHTSVQFDAVTGRVYVGANIGVWESADQGATWRPLQNGLPDAPVLDLQIHPTARLLRASLHGRGIFEWKLDSPILPDVELYVRDTALDTGRNVNTDGRPDPTRAPGGSVAHWLSPNIKVDVPTSAGYQTPTTSIDFLTFNEVLVDGSGGVATIAAPPTVHNRVYVEVHNRGRADATNVRVMAAITNAATGLTLPSGYTASVVAGTPIGGLWTTLGVTTIPLIQAGFPQIASFDLPSTSLPLPASLPGASHYCLVTFIHSASDAFASTERNVDLLTLSDRKVGQKNLHIIEFVGTPPPPKNSTGRWAMLGISGSNLEGKRRIDLSIDARAFQGTLHFVLPSGLFPADPKKQAEGFAVGATDTVKAWAGRQTEDAKRLFHEAKYPADQFELMTSAVAKVAGQKPLVLAGGKAATLKGLPLSNKDDHFIFIRVDASEKSKPGASTFFDVTQTDSTTGAFLGASRYQVVINRTK
jgi:photosystem II stability/assembly factor-like uncharacterized protein